jgi:exosortase/archaeosortase family protein
MRASAAAKTIERDASWLLPAICLVAAMWPVWTWYVRRLTDGSDEPWGIGALLLALFLVLRRWQPEPLGTARCFAIAGLLGLYAAGFGVLPPLVRAMLAVSALAIVFTPKRGAVGVWSLLLLSLPVIATMHFYLGYPLRVLTAAASMGILHGAGFDVTRTGLTMWWRGVSVTVDAPCSGIRMLWGGLVVAAGLCAWHGTRAWPALLVMAVSVAVIVVVNVIRVTLLFFKEAHVVHLPEWTHEGIGCLCFAFALLAILALPKLLDRAPGV